MMKRNMISALLATLAAGLFLVGYILDRQNNHEYIESYHHNVRSQLIEMQGKLQNQITSDIQLANGLVSFIATHPDMSEKDFHQAAAPLFGRGSNLRNIGVAPDMVIRMIYPLKGNEKAIGLDYRKLPEQFELAEKARVSKELALAGPLPLVQGGMGLIGRLPIYTSAEGGEEKFWGLVSAVIDVDALFSHAGVMDHDSSFELAIKHDASPDEELFFGSVAVFAHNPERIAVALPGGKWQIAAVPVGGWPEYADNVMNFRLLLLFCGLLIVIPFFFSLRTLRRLRNAEARLFLEKDRFLTTLEKSPSVAVQWFDQQGRVLFWNRASEKLFGWKSAEAIGKTMSQLTHSEQQQSEFLEKIGSISLEHNEPVVFDIGLSHRNGRQVQAHTSLFAIEGESGEPIYVCMEIDITFRMIMGKQLQDRAEQLKAIADYTSGWESWLTPDGKIQWVNPAVEQLTGYSMIECMDMDDYPLSIICKQDREAFSRTLNKSLQQRTSVNDLTFRIEHKNSSLRWIAVSWQPIYDQKGEYSGLRISGHDIADRKETELELQKSRRRYQELLDDMGDRFIVYSHEAESNKLLYLSKGFEAVTGIAKASALGKSWADIIQWTPETMEHATAKLQSLLNNEVDSIHLTMDFNHADGELHTIEVTSHAVRSEQGELLSIDGIAIDVTRQKRTQRALKSSEEKLRGLYELAPLGIALTDMEGRYIEFNDAFADICGYPADELKELDYWTLTPIRYADDEAKQLELLDKTGHYGPYEKEYIRKDGTAVPIQLTGMLLQGSDGKRYIWSIVEEITARKQRENMLRTAAAAFDTQEAITITDARNRIISVNNAFVEVTGYSAEEVLGKQPSLLSSGRHDKDFYDKMWKELIATGRWKGEIINRRKNGEIFPEQLSITASRDENGNVVNYIAVFSDITEKKELEKQLRQAQKMDAVATLITGIAHEFNNMLVGISGNIFLAKDMIGPENAAYERLDKAETISFKAGKIIEQLLVFARKDFLIHDVQPVNMVAWLADGLSLFRTSLPANIQLECNTGPGKELVIRADTTQLQQIVMNLINNARDAVLQRAKPRIQLELSSGKASPSFRKLHKEFKGQKYACLTVQDNGVGIAPDKLDKIFEPFFTTKEVGKGTGLGMSVIQGLVHSLHGGIEVESEEGSGTTFYIYLPLVAAPKPEPIAEAVPDEVVNGAGETILVADDEPEVLELTTRILQGLGYKTMAAGDGEEAVALFEKEQASIDLLLLDVMMPKLSGPNAAREMRALKPDVPVIFCTGYSADEMRDKMQDLGAIKVIGKPVKVPDMSKAIHDMLKREGA